MLRRPVKEDVIPACDVFTEISTLKRLRRTPNSNSETRHEESKARQSGKDLDLALLGLRTTPIDSKLPSPADVLNGRKAQSALLTKIVDTRQDHGEMRERLQERQNKMTPVGE